MSANSLRGTLLSSLFCAFLLLGTCQPAKILGLFHLPSPSHHIIMGVLFRELAARGHEVTVISPYPTGENLANFTEIDIDGLLAPEKGWNTNFFDDKEGPVARMVRMHTAISDMCRHTLASEGLNELLRSDAQFDVMIVTPVMCEALIGIADHFDAPAITFMPQGSNVVMDRIFGNTAPYAYVANPILAINYPMTFFDRLKNTLINTVMDVLMNWYMLHAQEELLQRHFPRAPGLAEVMDRVQLGLFASHPAIESPRPSMPNMIQIGGIQMERPERLPGDLQRLLDGAQERGVIYFSFGTNIRTATLPESTISHLVQVFRERGELVLWKFEEDIADLPENVVTMKWLPQRAVLAHPSVRVFITHGGLGGVTESTYNGVPMVCIPIFGDQFNNCQDSDHKGIAKLLAISELNRETLKDALEDVINNPKYRAAISARSDLFRAQPINNMDKAIFWIDHVIKHKGAAHLRSPAKDLNWFQLMLLDVIGFVVLVLALAFGATYWCLRMLWKLIRRGKKTDKKKSKKE